MAGVVKSDVHTMFHHTSIYTIYHECTSDDYSRSPSKKQRTEVRHAKAIAKSLVAIGDTNTGEPIGTQGTDHYGPAAGPSHPQSTYSRHRCQVYHYHQTTQ